MFVKICGITNEDDALLSVAMGADALGFNFVSGSVRQIAPQVSYDITRRLPAEILTVGVFRNELPERVISLAHKAGVKAVQLHGHETPEQCIEIAKQFRWVIKAFSAGDPNLPRADEYGTDMVMIDGAEPGFRQSLRLVARRRCARQHEVDPGGRADPRERGGGDQRGAAVGRRRGIRRRALTGPQGRARREALHRERPRRSAVAVSGR